MSKIFGSMKGAPALTKAMSILSKEPAKAMQEAEKVLSSSPTNAQALKVIAEAAETLDFPGTAVFSYEMIREGSPDDLDVLMELGRLYQLNKEPDKSRECFQKAYDIDPANAKAFQGLKDATANAAMQSGNWENATSSKDLVRNKGEAQSLEEANRIYKDEETLRRQMNEVFQLTQAEPQNVSHWKKLGDLALQANEFDYAVQCYQHAFEMTSRADINLEKLITMARNKKIGAAIKVKETELEVDPSNEAIQSELKALQSEREHVLLEDCEARSKRYPNDLEIKYELAQIYYRNGMIDKAVPEFQMAANNPKNKVLCNMWMGRCFRQKGILDMAVDRFKLANEQLLVMDRTKKEVLYDLGCTMEQMGKVDEAMEQFKSIYSVDVGFADVGQKIEAYYKSKALKN